MLEGAVIISVVEWEGQIEATSYHKVKVYNRSLNYGRITNVTTEKPIEEENDDLKHR